MKRFILASLALALVAPVLMLTGCPKNASTLQKAALASENAAIVVRSMETAEIAAYQQGLIPAGDHLFIQQQVVTLSALGKTTDTCIGNAGTTAGAVVCINSAVTQIDQINTNGGLYLKSAKAQELFTTAMGSIKTVLVSIETVLNGVPVAAIVSNPVTGL